MKVIIIDWGFKKGVVAEGEWDGKLVDNQYAKISGELYNTQTMYVDTPETRKLIQEIMVEKKRLEDAAHSYFFESLNKLHSARAVKNK